MSRRHSSDRGMTLVELLVVTSLLGLVMFVIAATFVTILRVTPSTEYRIDDARSTRGLHTWLVRDIGSTPPHVYDPGTGTGFVDGVWASPTAAGVPPGDVCISGGTHVLFMAWSDEGRSYRAQYTIEGSATGGYEVVRTICGEDTAQMSLTGDVSSAACAASQRSTLTTADVDGDGAIEAAVELCLVSTQSENDGLLSGDRQQEITLSVASRNGDT